MNNIENARKDFPVLATHMNGKPLAFLDTAASAQKPQIVIDTMRDVMEHKYANIHRGLYALSQDLTTQYEAVRVKVADFIQAESQDNIVFTRNSTEAINLVAQSWGRTFLQAGDEIILSQMEHHANIVPWQLLQKQIGIEIKVIPVTDKGELDLEEFERLLTPRTKLVSIVHVSNALGTINPVYEIIETAKDFYADMKVLIDGSQAVAHGYVNVLEMNADFYVFTGHKLYGPTGVGVLYGKHDLLNSMPPYQGGGDMIERVSFDGTEFKEAPYRFEAGTPAIVEVIGLGAAIDYFRSHEIGTIETREEALLDYATHELLKIDGLKIYGTALKKVGIMSFTIDGAHPSDVAMILDQCGVAVRSGHHCCMPLMERYGLDATIRASLGLYSNKDDINQLLEGLHKAKDMLL
ncbi:cysteine desulfurase [Alphaproteobacteria bacterium]|nr:cysteine desulfurase [Alphaproteobacteria bacterium]